MNTQQAKASMAYAALSAKGDNISLKGTVRIVVHDQNGAEVDAHELFSGVQIGGGVLGDSFLNQSLNTAKVIFSKLAAGDINYKIGRIAFGNVGHNLDNPKQAVAATPADVELQASSLIKASFANAGDEYTYTHNAVKNRIVYIEKEILAGNVSFGANGDQFIVRVPIDFSEFNSRVGDPGAGTDSKYVDELVTYTLIDDSNNLIKVGPAKDADGSPADGYTNTEVKVDTGGPSYTFKNGLDANGDVDASNGGIRPQEISEVLLLTDVFAESGVNKKISAARITSGLLSFPENFNFTFEWSLSWNFS